MKTQTMLLPALAALCSSMTYAAQVYYTWAKEPYVDSPDSVSSLNYYTYSAQAEPQRDFCGGSC